MKILFGVPDKTHRELANLEIEGIKSFNVNCDTINYGPSHSKKNYLNKLIRTVENAILIKKALKSKEYDILFLNTAFDPTAILRDWITLLILRDTTTKIFLKTHGTDLQLLSKLKAYHRLMFNYIIKKVQVMGVLSNEERNSFIQTGYPANKILTIKNPINPDLYRTNKAFKSTLNLDNSTFIFIFCSRFIPTKGLLEVLEAFKIVLSTYKNIHLFCIGDGPEMPKAKNFIKEQFLNNHVTLTGFISEKQTRDFYSSADALVFPTRHQEGFPMVVFQSLAAGICIITTRIRAAADYLKDPDNLLWVDPINHQQIAESMMRLISDKKLVQNMRDNNIIASQRFRTEKNAIEYINIFSRMIKD